MSNNLQDELKFYYQLSQKYYKLYLENDKIYLYARGLYMSNKKIVSILEQLVSLNRLNNIQNTIDLLIHYNNWMTQFQLQEQEIKPKADTTFVFLRLKGDIVFNHEYIEELF